LIKGFIMLLKLITAGIISAGLLLSSEANAALSLFNTWTGNVGYSSDGFGSVDQSGIISASVPVGSTVLGAYLYTGLFDTNLSSTYTGTLNGSAVTFNSLGINTPACCNISAARADVTSIVAPIINGGAGGVYDFNLTENSSSQDGEALVVVYSNPALTNRTFAMLDGFASVTGDTASLNFSSPLNPSAPGFNAEMFLGINFSCCDQKSTVSVNGTVITNNAGNNDDGVGTISNGQLITVGGFDDPYSTLLPDYANDHERYNLIPYITTGDTSIVVKTSNSSLDDNIFLAGFYVTGLAGINEPPPAVPEPETYGMMMLGLGLIGFVTRRCRHNKT
jgi:hypothetical protein